MGSDRRRAWPFAARLALRGALAGGLIFASLWLAGTGRTVSAGIALLIAGIVAFDLIRVAKQAERAMRNLVEQLAVGADDLPAKLDPAFRDLDSAIVRALARVGSDRARYGAEAGALQALLDTVAAALFVTDPAGKIVFANRAARALAQSDMSDLAQHPAFAAQDALALTGGRPASGRILRLKDGRAALAGVGLYDLPDGTPRRMVSVQIVSEELSAVELNAWHHLSRVLAHEMMNSLSPVVSLAESLAAMMAEPEGGRDQGAIAQAVELIASRATHLMGFVERYRAMLAIPEPEPAPTPLFDVASGLAGVVRAGARHVDVRTRVDPPTLAASIDRELVEQAVLNLLKNAVEAVEGVEQPEILLACEEDGNAIRIDVIDNGQGLPADPESLFLPFYTTKSGGSGIGLAVARQIAVAHHGTLTAEPLDKGARFSLRLPTG